MPTQSLLASPAASGATDVFSTVIITGDETHGMFSLVAVVLPPHNAGVPTHRHAQHSEGCYVIAGTLALTESGRTTTLTAGAAAHIAPGAVHTFWNPTAAPTTILLVYYPGVSAAEMARLIAGTDHAAGCDIGAGPPPGINQEEHAVRSPYSPQPL